MNYESYILSFCIFIINPSSRMQINLGELFPDLDNHLNLSDVDITPSDLEGNQYFIDLVDQLVEDYRIGNQTNPKQKQVKNQQPFQLKDIKEFTQIKSIISKIGKRAIPIKVPRGTIIYTTGMSPDYGYFLIHGCVELLSKKNTWQKLENFQGHTMYRPQQRMDYLQSSYHIDPKHFPILESVFFEENVLFNFLPYRKLYSRSYFGFREIMGGSLRTKTAIAIQQTLLLKLRRQDFDKYLKQFEEKREFYIMGNMLLNSRPQIIQQISPKLRSVFNSAEIISFDKGQVIIKQGQFANSVYFLLSGEAVVSKTVKIDVPKKYLTNQNKGDLVKQMQINLHKIVRNSLFGEIEPLLSKKQRQLSFHACINGTVAIKFDSSAFMKVVGQSASYQRELVISAKYKFSTTMESYMSQRNAIVKSYFQQCEELDHRKKEKNVANLLKNDGNFKQNELYELFKRQGAFFRDSFERLEGFDEFESKYDPKRSSIHRHKIKSTQEIQTTDPKPRKIQNSPLQKSPKSPHNQSDISFQTMKKTLMSPAKSSNPFDILSPDIRSKLEPVSEESELTSNKSTSSLRKKKRLFSKFQELKKDEAIFKRVLIKNGEFDVKRQTQKCNRIQAIVNHKFDQVVKQCMSRKNVGLRKALQDNRQDIVKEEFMRTVASLPTRSYSTGRFQSSNSVAFTCKGTEQMRKKLEKFKHLRGSAPNISEKPMESSKLQDCIGFNKKPLSSDVKQRSTFMSVTKSVQRSPDRIILLNHMMKPIIYTSAQI